MRKKISQWLQTIWYSKPNIISYLLLPFSWIYILINYLRYSAYFLGLFPIKKFDVPVIIVGNITVGGTGKTPVVMAITQLLQEAGYKPGIISRGYHSQNSNYPLLIDAKTDVNTAGDEAYLLALKTQAPVVVDPKRVRGVQYLIEKQQCNCIISDDGLQHYALGRDVEILLVDKSRGFGNGFCLPAGPLREPHSRLKDADFVLYKSLGTQLAEQDFYYVAENLIELLTGNSRPAQAERDQKVHAVCAIANPEHFFKTLELLGWNIEPHVFPDHYRFTKTDFDFGDDAPVIMTQKDAVKCMDFADKRFWYLSISVALPQRFAQQLLGKLSKEENYHGKFQ